MDVGISDSFEISPRRLDRQQHVAVEVPGEGKLVVVDEEGSRVRAPSAIHRIADGCGKCPVPGPGGGKVSMDLGALIQLLGGEPAQVAGQRLQQHLSEVVGAVELFWDVVAILGHSDEEPS